MKMRILFICQNADLRSAEEIIIGEILSKQGFDVRIHETKDKTNEDIKPILKEYDLIIFPNEETNGFKPGIINGDIYKQIVFTI